MKKNILLNVLCIVTYVLITVFFVIMFGCNKSFGQDTTRDDLLTKAQSTKASIEKVEALNELCWKNRIADPNKAIQYGVQALKCSETLKYYDGNAAAFIDLGYIYTHQSKFDEAKDCYNKGMKSANQIRDVKKKKIETARVYEGMGLIYYMNHEYEKSTDSYEKALKIFRETGMRNNIAICYHILGMIYEKSGLESKAKESYYMEQMINKTSNNTDNSTSSYQDFESTKDE